MALAKSLINMAMDLGRAGVSTNHCIRNGVEKTMLIRDQNEKQTRISQYNDDMRGGRDYRRDGGRGEERRGGHR